MLFTAGMTLLDSIDSVLMLYSYSGFPERRFRIFEPVEVNSATEERDGDYQEAVATTQTSRLNDGDSSQHGLLAEVDHASTEQPEPNCVPNQDKKRQIETVVEEAGENIRNRREENMAVKRNMMSGLSIVLTLMSIIVAFR